MAGPITWRNVSGPSAAEASRPLDSARLALTDGFDRLGKTLQNYEAGETRIAERVDDGRVQAFMDRLQQVKTPEQIAQMQASGELDTLRQGMSAKSLGLTRGADEARLGNLMTGIEKANTFNDSARLRAEKPLVQQYNTLLANNDFEGAKAFLAGEGAGLSNRAELINIGRTTQLKADEDAFKATLLPAQRDTQRLQGEEANRVAKSNAATASGRTALEAAKVTSETDTLKQGDEDKLVKRLSAEAKSAREKQLTEVRGVLGGLATEFGLPVTASGAPDVDAMNDEQRSLLDSVAANRGMPTLEALYEGDTKADAAFRAQLRDQYGVSAVAIERNAPTISAASDSTNLGKAVGANANQIRINQAQADVELDEKMATNPYVPGSANAAAVFEEVRKMLPSLIPESAKEDLPEIVKLLNDLTTEGLVMSDGTKITPSKQDIISAITGQSGTWNFFDASRAGDIKADLKKKLDTPRVSELLKEAENAQKQQRGRAVRNILSK